MICETCGRQTDLWICLPIHQQDGTLNSLVCLSCAEKSDAYCHMHEMPHIGFSDGTHACIPCINDAFRIYGAQIGRCLLDRIDLADGRWQPLLSWAEDVMPITNEFYPSIIGRAVITLGLRLHQNEEWIIHQTLIYGPDYLLFHESGATYDTEYR
jgi:hypothetical protein